MLLPADIVAGHFSVEELAEHITGFTLAACDGLRTGAAGRITRNEKNRQPVGAANLSLDHQK